jgi:hypothetical protein
MPGVTLDAAGLIALDRDDRRVMVLLARATDTGTRVTVPHFRHRRCARGDLRAAR